MTRSPRPITIRSTACSRTRSALEPPLADRPENCKTLADYEKQAGPQRQKIQQLIDTQYALQCETARKRVGDYLFRAATTEPDLAETAIYFLSLAPSDLRPPIVQRRRKYLDDPARERSGLRSLARADAFARADLCRDAAAVPARWQSKPIGLVAGQLNPLVRDALKSAKAARKADVARFYGTLFEAVHVHTKGKTPTAAEQQLLDVLTSKDSPCYFPRSQTAQYLSRSEKDAYNNLRTQFDKIAVKLAAPPARWCWPTPPTWWKQKSSCAAIPPFSAKRCRAASSACWRARARARATSAEPFAHGSGRLDLARAITAKGNPLTSRVLVNRVWMHHFGEPLVASPSDFGTRSTPPSHPELLDWLAWTVMNEGKGWSLKRLHRHIVLSAAYQQASFDRADARKIDPENRLYWRAHRRRLDFEAMRNAMLVCAGRLDRSLGGRPVDIVKDVKNARRTVYALVDRQSLPGVFRAFDFAVPDQSVERRPMTTVPQQALFGLNSPFMAEQARPAGGPYRKAQRRSACA